MANNLKTDIGTVKQGVKGAISNDKSKISNFTNRVYNANNLTPQNYSVDYKNGLLSDEYLTSINKSISTYKQKLNNDDFISTKLSALKDTEGYTPNTFGVDTTENGVVGLPTDALPYFTSNYQFADNKKISNDNTQRNSEIETAKTTSNAVKETNGANVSKQPSVTTTPTTAILNSSTSANNSNTVYRPFDLRLQRMMAYGNKGTKDNRIYGYEDMPYSNKSEYISTNDYILDVSTFEKISQGIAGADEHKKVLEEKIAAAKQDKFFTGTSAIMNPYAIIKLYGAEGSKYLLNQKFQRRFYEIDGNNNLNYSLNPTTSSLISWGNNDPFERTPYSFSDFVFCKYWNIIPNNRLITLRRYSAPILDNLSFPGMEGEIGGENIMFPPMATAVTYFGENTGNKLSDLLRFSTGYKWKDLDADVWEVTSQQIDAGTVWDQYGPMGMIARAYSVLKQDDYNFAAHINNMAEPPDPFLNGTYTNVILGPVDSINSVKMRDRGLTFDMSNLKLTFEYCSRPIGGVNSKAAMLDILSNFLVLGSATAVFFGGALRFKVKQAAFPFGNPDLMKKIYSGNATGAFKDMIGTLASINGQDATNLLGASASIIAQSAQGLSMIPGVKEFAQKMSNAAGNPGDGTGYANANEQTMGVNGQNFIVGEVMKNVGIPYFLGMRSLLTGEPVGDWHLTVGNPLNPIALIGNLICKSVEIECNDELGPDDFPTEWKMTVSLEHGMPRDKTAIESMFNRGAGRIYELPDDFKSSADKQTAVDSVTKGIANGKSKSNGAYDYWSTPYNSTNATIGYGSMKMKTTSLSNAGDSASVWNKTHFESYDSDTLSNFSTASINTRSIHGSVEWIAKTIK